MQMISEAIVAGSLEAIRLQRESVEEAEKRRVEAGTANRAERRRVAALERKKKRQVGANA